MRFFPCRYLVFLPRDSTRIRAAVNWFFTALRQTLFLRRLFKIFQLAPTFNEYLVWTTPEISPCPSSCSGLSRVVDLVGTRFLLLIALSPVEEEVRSPRLESFYLVLLSPYSHFLCWQYLGSCSDTAVQVADDHNPQRLVLKNQLHSLSQPFFTFPEFIDNLQRFPFLDSSARTEVMWTFVFLLLLVSSSRWSNCDESIPARFKT